MKKFVIEFIGTFFLVLTIGLSGGNPLAIGAVLAALVYMGGYISGAHFNPAVTLGVWWLKKIKGDEAAKYMFTQLLAALFAAGVYQIIIGSTFVVAPAAEVGFGAALLVEILFTFILVSTVLHVAVSDKAKNTYYYGIAIGFVVLAAVAAGGTISGGAFNPAVGLGTNLFDVSTLSQHYSNLALYLVGPFVGGIIAAYVFRYTVER